MKSKRIGCVLLVALALGLIWVVGCSSGTVGGNRPPVADAGTDLVVELGKTAVLDASGSFDPDRDSLTYRWELVTVPAGGQAALGAQEGATIELTPDVLGVWVVRLVVSDGQVDSEPDVVQVQSVPATTCVDDGDCDDGLWCNGEEGCVDGSCEYGSRDCSDVEDQCNGSECDEDSDQCVPVPVADGTGCDDGFWCTVGDVCSAGVCGGTERDCSEADGECQAGACDEVRQECQGQALADGTICDDGMYCTVSEKCIGGVCAGGEPRACGAAGGGCMDGICDEDRDACVGDPLSSGFPCNDGLFCTVSDACDGLGECIGNPRDCSLLANQCNQGTCDELRLQCVAEPINEGSACDDGLYCGIDETCRSGSCESEAGRDCDDSDTCTWDACDEANDSCYNELTPRPLAEGLWDDPTCGDSVDNDCDRLVDLEDPECRECGNDGDCDDGNPCTVNTCGADLRCSVTIKNNGTSCDDGRFCTDPDSCTDGVCRGPARDCGGVSDQCNLGVCNEMADQCEPQAINAGMVCDDGQYCSVDETCQSGACTGGQARDCGGLDDQCNQGVCNEAADQCEPQAINEGMACDDGQYCSVDETCQLGVCTGGQARDCSGAGDQCNDGVCVEVANLCQAQPKASGTPCDDGVYCNGADECDGSGGCSVNIGNPCIGGNECNRTCNETDGNCHDPAGIACGDAADTECTDPDACDGAGNCVSNDEPAGTACDDGLYCTGADECDGTGGCGVHTGDPCAGGSQCNQTCNETAQNCYDPAGTGCDDGVYCNGADECDGSGGCNVHPGDPCTGGSQCNVVCNETDDNCYDPAGTACDDSIYCNGTDECDATGGCNVHTGDPCTGGNQCNIVCNETNDNCFDPAGTQCTDTAPDDCNDAQCDGTGSCDQTHAVEPSTYACRPVADLCDVADYCDGASGGCPANAVEPNTTECRPAAGECDAAENCDGGSPSCPADGDRPDGSACFGSDLDVCNSSCQAGVCVDAPPANAGEPCDDGYDCTDSDQCDGSGICAGIENDAYCDAINTGDVCWPVCSPDTSGCVDPPGSMGLTCEDPVALPDNDSVCDITIAGGTLTSQENCLLCYAKVGITVMDSVDFDDGSGQCHDDNWGLVPGAGLHCSQSLNGCIPGGGSTDCCGQFATICDTATFGNPVLRTDLAQNCTSTYKQWRLAKFFNVSGLTDLQVCFDFAEEGAGDDEGILIYTADSSHPSEQIFCKNNGPADTVDLLFYRFCADLPAWASNSTDLTILFIMHSNQAGEILYLDNVEVRGWSGGCARDIQTILADNFNGCDLSSWTVVGTPDCPGQFDCDGSDNLWVESDSWSIERTGIDASNLDGYVELCFDLGDDNADSAGDSIHVEFNAGTAWQTAWYQDSQMGTDDNCYQVCVNLSAIDPGVNNNPSLGIRFTLSSDQGNDEIALDNVLLRGAQYCLADASVLDLSIPPQDRGGGIYRFTATDIPGTPMTPDIRCYWDPDPNHNAAGSVWYRR